MPLRFVILHHTGIETPHFDFMFEMEPDALLTTFRCPAWPPAPGDAWEELAEHRRAYLDYEGPISGGRGFVKQIESGTIEHIVLSSDPPTLGLALDGAQQLLDVSITHWLDPTIDSATKWLVQTVEVPSENESNDL